MPSWNRPGLWTAEIVMLELHGQNTEESCQFLVQQMSQPETCLHQERAPFIQNSAFQTAGVNRSPYWMITQEKGLHTS